MRIFGQWHEHTQEKKKKDNARCTILNRITQRLHYHLGNFLESDLAIG